MSLLRPETVRSIMLAVVVALLPGTALYAYQYGVVVWVQTGWCILFALLVEGLFLSMRGQPLRHGLGDMSWLVSGWIMGRALSLMTPLWLMLLATVFALGLAKHGSGGLGRNRLNPVMAGLGVVAVVFYQLLYPAPAWPQPWTLDLGVFEVLNLEWVWRATPPHDAIASATPLAKGLLDEAAPYLSWAGYLGGGLLLALLRVIRLEIPLAMMASSVLTSMLLGHTPTEALNGLTLGGWVFAAFFIATDPVTSPDRGLGRVLFGLLIGVLTECIRAFGLYPDGLCFAVLAGNLLVPQLDWVAQRCWPKSWKGRLA